MSFLGNRKFLSSVAVAALAVTMVFLFNMFRRTQLAFAPLTPEAASAEAKGKSILIVGGTKGIGAGLAKALLEKGSNVVVAGRSKGEETPERAEFIKYDASLMTNGFDFVRNQLQGRKFDTVVFTVGTITRSKLTRTAEGVEEDLAISYMSRFVIANELIRAGVLEGRKRIYIMGYPGEKQEPVDINDINFEKIPYKQIGAHLNTVVFNEALVYQLTQRYPDVRVYGLNPGLIKTGIRDNFHGGSETFFGRAVEFLIGLTNPTVEQYVDRTLLPLVLAPELQDKPGTTYSKTGASLSKASWMSSQENRAKVWTESQKLLSKSVPGAPVY